MKHSDKIKWMEDWVSKFYNEITEVRLELEGECGFGRECVGIIVNGIYPDYNWYDTEDDLECLDENSDVFIPEDAYHKHDCVAVLGRGEVAESQLYDWLKWFNDNNFTIETGNFEGVTDPICVMLGKDRFCRMVKG